MNFMSGRQGFCKELTGTRGLSSSSSSTSSFQHRGFPSYTYHQHQESYGGPLPLEHSYPTNNGGRGDEPPEDSDGHMPLGGEGTSSGAVVIQREHMFDKVVTPSDVGKLNRLVIPKQHAEKYFPLDSSTNEKGLLLNFEDRNGKPWRFRYSYWNSSQSYVMTKGWSRFVKEKKLDAGDIVSFQRGMGELGKDRLFIDWRRRPDAPELPPSFPTLSIPNQFSFRRSITHPWNPVFMQPPSREYSHWLQSNAITPQYHHQSRPPPTGYGPHSYNSVVNGNPCPPGSVVYRRSGRGASSGGVFGTQHVGMGQAQRGSEQMVFESVPVVQGKAAAKRLRLFGVNMDCPISESDECDILSSTKLPLLHQMPPTPFDSSSSSSSTNLQLRPNDDKGKDSMSLDLDI